MSYLFKEKVTYFDGKFLSDPIETYQNINLRSRLFRIFPFLKDILLSQANIIKINNNLIIK